MLTGCGRSKLALYAVLEVGHATHPPIGGNW
jgi:hypothetical protein